MGIATTTPPVCTATICLVCTETSDRYRQCGNGERDRGAAIRSNFRLPPKVTAGYVSQSSPTVADSSLPPDVSEQQQSQSNATAAGDESSASVCAPWLSPLRHPGEKGDGAPRRDGTPGRVSPRRRRAPPNQSRGEWAGDARRTGSAGNSPRDAPAAEAPPHRRQQSQWGNNGPQTQPRRATKIPQQLTRQWYRAHDPPLARRRYA